MIRIVRDDVYICNCDLIKTVKMFIGIYHFFFLSIFMYICCKRFVFVYKTLSFNMSAYQYTTLDS